MIELRPGCLPPRHMAGFTLIELVVVIMILAILGGLTLPAYFNLGQDTRVTTLQQMAATLNTASAQLRARCGLTQGCPMSAGAYSLPHNGQTYAMRHGHLAAGDSAAEVGIEAAIQYEGFTLVKSPNRHTFTKDGAPVPANCSVTYTEALTAGSAATVSMVTTGC